MTAGTPEAGLDAGARFPPPKCHPGSRRTIKAKLEEWLFSIDHQRKMFWLHGPAGVGKSAVAQTFAELARDGTRLGAAYFFSALDDTLRRSNPLRVVPSLAYQLAILNEPYKQALTHLLATDPAILYAALHVQFQRLIIEPFSLLASHSRQATENPYLIVVDGLDECSDERAQCKLVQLISNAAQRSDLPLLWLVCSRPEPHITYTFSRLDSDILCDRGELSIDDEARADVERYLRDSFVEIHESYRHVITVPRGGCWPPQDTFGVVSRASSGLFVFASTVVRVVDDPTIGDPDAQLKSLSSMLQGLEDIGIHNPLQALDIFYSRILSKVPQHILSVAIQILGFCVYQDAFFGTVYYTSRKVWMFCGIGQGVYYSALQKLHSVARVPSHENAPNDCLSFYHKSFSDYLGSQHRSGKYHLSRKRFTATFVSNGLRVYNSILMYEHPDRIGVEEHACAQAILAQCSAESDLDYSEIRLNVRISPGVLFLMGDNADVFDAPREFNFGLLDKSYDLVMILKAATHQNWNQNIAQNFIHTGVINGSRTDEQLLYHLSILAD
ncbi:hypothetical protein P691DRAFT_739153, partial [Macrolepiota fuliginosa MF-IS2]